MFFYEQVSYKEKYWYDDCYCLFLLGYMCQDWEDWDEFCAPTEVSSNIGSQTRRRKCDKKVENPDLPEFEEQIEVRECTPNIGI